MAASDLTTRTKRQAGVTEWVRGLLFVVLGAASIILYYNLMAVPYSLSRYYDEPLLDLVKIARIVYGGMTPEVGWGLIWGWLLLLLLYVAAYILAPRRLQVGLAVPLIIFFVPAIALYLLAQVYPVGAADIFDYIMRGRMLGLYGANPFAITPDHFQSDPFYPYLAWGGATSAYGPVWEWLAAATTAVGGNNLWANIIAFKGLAILSYFANAVLILLIVGRQHPDWAWRGMVLYLWNPLVLFEVAVNAHNDLLMMTGVLAAFLLLDRVKGLWTRPAASFLVVIAALIKFLAAPLLPLFWLDGLRDRSQTWPRRGLVLAVSVVVAVLPAVLLYLPFWQGEDPLGAGRRAEMFTASLPNVFRFALHGMFDIEKGTATAIARLTAIAIFGLVGLYQAWRLWLGRTTLVRACFEVLFFYLLFSCLWFQPWYLLWFIALAPLIPDWGVAVRTIAFCITAMANYVVWDMLLFWVFLPQGGDMLEPINWTSAYFVYPIPILLTLGFFIYDRWRSQRTDNLKQEDANNLDTSIGDHPDLQRA